MKKFLFSLPVILSLLNGVPADAADEEYLIVNFYGPATEENAFQLPLSEDIRTRFKKEILNCTVNIPNASYMLGFQVDARPGTYINDFISTRMGVMRLTSSNPAEGELVTESEHTAMAFKDISLAVKFKESNTKTYFLNLASDKLHGWGSHAKEMLKFPISEHSTNEPSKELFSCYFYNMDQ